MKTAQTVALAVGALLLLAAPALADWAEGDSYKMHFPQLPDPQGWDIDIVQPRVVADDWRCTQTGPVSDIHFWFSVEGDDIDAAFDAFQSLHVSIHKDIADPDGTGPELSMPGELLWQRDFTDFVVAGPWLGDQGWADPMRQIWRRPDHKMYFQVNVTDIDKPFIQEEGNVYWLDLSVQMPDDWQGPDIGWKTSMEHWNDDAVYSSPTAPTQWNELISPEGPSLDMAFVITTIPEPSTLALFGIAALVGLVAYARRSK